MLKILQKDLLAMDFEDVLGKFRFMVHDLEAENLMKAAFSFNLSRKVIERYTREYYERPIAEFSNW